MEALQNHLNSQNHQNLAGNVQASTNFQQSYPGTQQNQHKDGTGSNPGMQELDSSKDVNRSADINRIKTLLAKKLRHNQAFPSQVPTSKASDQSSTPHFVTGTYGEPQVALPNFYDPQQSSQSEYNQYTPAAESHYSTTQTTESPYDAAASSPCHTSYTTEANSSLASSQQWQPPSQPQTPHSANLNIAHKSTSKSKKGNTSPIRSPAALVPRAASPKTTSPKRRSSHGSRPSSPRAGSPRSYDLEVCGEVEKAKDIVRQGLEARIERVENKGLQLHLERMAKTIEKPSSVQNDCELQTSEDVPERLPMFTLLLNCCLFHTFRNTQILKSCISASTWM